MNRYKISSFSNVESIDISIAIVTLSSQNDKCRTMTIRTRQYI